MVRKPNAGRQARQNTQITTQGTAEEQFAQIETAARAQALVDIDDILTDNDSGDDLPPPQQPLEPQIE